MGKKQTKTLTREHLRKLWGFIGTERWQALLKEFKPNNRFNPAGFETLKGLCVHPDHADTAPSFYIYVGRCYAKCYGGSCNYYESNPLRLIAYILDSSYTDALQYVQTHYKPPFIPRKAAAELEAHRLNQELKHEIFAAAHQLMCAAIGDPSNNQYSYATKALDWLINTRGITESSLHALPVAILPEIGRLPDQLHERYKVQYQHWLREGNPGIAEPTLHAESSNHYFADHVRDPVYSGGILLPLFSTPSEIGNFKIRSPDASKKFLVVQDEHEEQLGLFGLGWDRYKPFWGRGDQKGFTHIFEGEFDVLSLMSRYVDTNSVAFPAISAGGSGGAPYIEQCLRSSGISKVFLVGDAPHAKGNDVVQKWMENIRDLEVSIFSSWDKFPGLSDFDDVVKAKGISEVVSALWDNRETTFSPPWSWASGRANEDLFAIPEQEFRARMEVAARHGKYLHHHLESAKYLDVIEVDHNLNKKLLRREITAREGTEMGFVQSCEDALRERYFMVGTYHVRGSRFLALYDTKRKLYSNFELGKPGAATSELAHIEGTLVRFVTSHVGCPEFLEFPTSDTEGLILATLEKQLANYLGMAILNMAQGAPDFMTAKRYKQGYHCIRNKKEILEYIVCGSEVFQIRREGASHTYAQLEGPAVPEKNIIFDVGINSNMATEAWYPGGLSSKKLAKGDAVDLKKLYEDLVDVYDSGYKFKNHDVTARLLATLMLVYPIMDAFNRPILLFVTGDTSSGKSSLLSTFTGMGYTGVRLLYSSQGYESYSAAGVAGYADCDSRLLALDEFESGDESRGLIVSSIMEMFRGLVSGEATRVRGRADGSAFTQTFRLPVIFSAIKGAERPQDLNRVICLEMQKVEGKINCVHLIQDAVGVDRLEEMAQEIAVGMYPHAIELAQLEATIQKEFIELQKTDQIFKIEWRLASSLFPVLAVQKFLGLDWVEFLRQYIEEHTYSIQQTAVASETQGYLKAILRNPCIPQAEGQPMTISQLLVSPEQRDDINAANKGVYFDEKTECLLVLVDQGTGMIPYHLRGKMTGLHLKNVLERHPSALSPIEIERSGILLRVGRYMGAGIKLEDVVVLDAKPWLSAGNEDNEADEEPTLIPEEDDPNVIKPNFDDWGNTTA